MQSALIGLSVIILAWLYQLFASWKGRKSLNKAFVIIYGIGSALLVIDGYINDVLDVAIFNLVILVLAMIVLIFIGKDNTQKTVVKKKKR